MLHSLILKLKWLVSCRKLLGRQASYYPEAAHKSRLRIVHDQLRFFFKYGYLEEYYYPYGFDRAEMTRARMGEYIVPYRAFLYRVDQLNFQNPGFDAYEGRMTGRVLNQDKFYFFLFLRQLGYPTPRVLLYVRGGKDLYADPSVSSLEGLFSTDLDAFAKPVGGMMGAGGFRLQVRHGEIRVDGNVTTAESVAARLVSADYLVQDYVVQHERLSVLCPSCVNTLRLHTVMDQDGKVHAFGPLLRIGRVGNAVDNWAKGGVIVGIDKSGRLLDRGVMKPGYGTVTVEHPDTHVVFAGYELPFYHEAEAMVVSLHRLMYRNHSIGWDVAITPRGPVIIEGNDRWEISMIQAVHGPMGQIKRYF